MERKEEKSWFWTGSGIALLLYMVFVGAGRVYFRGSAGLFDLVWGCNMAIFLSAFGLLTRNTRLISAAAALVVFPHFCWWGDMICYFTMGIFPFGTAEYVIWPETPRLEIATTLHHVWFIPFSLYAVHKAGGIGWSCILDSCVITALLSIVALPIPKTTILADGSEFYLNVNMAHEFWRDVPFDIFHWFDPSRGFSLPVYHVWLNTIGFATTVLFKIALVAGSKLIERRSQPHFKNL